MGEVYVVTRGSYSDYGIVGIYSTRELAQAFIDATKGMEQELMLDYNEIEEYELDQHKSEIERGLKAFYVLMRRDGTVKEVRPQTYGGDLGYYFGDETFSCGVWAKDAEHAVKIVNEKRIAYLLNEQQGAT